MQRTLINDSRYVSRLISPTFQSNLHIRCQNLRIQLQHPIYRHHLTIKIPQQPPQSLTRPKSQILSTLLSTTWVIQQTQRTWALLPKDCSHKTERWWVQVTEVKECEKCSQEWGYLLECPSCGFLVCPACKAYFQYEKLYKGYAPARYGSNRGCRRRRRWGIGIELLGSNIC